MSAYPNTPFWDAFKSRTDIAQFGNNALLLFALQLKLPIEDIVSVASTSITDGTNDKKADFVYIDREEGVAIIAQGYFAEDFAKKEAKSNKASDLNTATSWLLSGEINELPIELQSHAQELRDAIESGEIDRLWLWYVHNLPESKNVKNELQQVEKTAKALLASGFEMNDAIQVQASEVGSGFLEELYTSISTPILVSEECELEIAGGQEIGQANWKAFVTAIPGKWLAEKYATYGTKMFSANVRDYLGSRKSNRNINEGIKSTAENSPEHFLVFNNGITILTNHFSIVKKSDKQFLTIKGISVINGAQTTGALSSLTAAPSDKILVQARFVVCSDQETLRDVVNFNNSQNKINAPDFRSNDQIQRRIESEFKKIPSVEYHPRRGGSEDIIKRRPNVLSSVTAGQTIAAFHRAPDIAYHKKTLIWESDALYAKYFNEHTTAKHITLAYALLKAVQNKKLALLSKSKTGSLTEVEDEHLKFYRKRGSIFMMVAAISSCLEIIANKKIANYFAISFKANLSPDEGAKVFEPIVDIASSFSTYLISGLSDGFKNDEAVRSSIEIFRSLIDSVKMANQKAYTELTEQIGLI